MAKKYYAVKAGKIPGIYENWKKCQDQINGFSGAIYKSFSTHEEAIDFIGDRKKRNTEQKEKTDISSETDKFQAEAIAYVDGSYDATTSLFSCGVVFFYKGQELHFSKKYNDSDLAEMNNVAGELKGAETAIQYCLDNQISSIIIYHDYEGIAKWCNGEWKAKKTGTMAYKEFYNKASKTVDIRFVKVKGHSGDEYNELADHLAKSAFILEESHVVTKEEAKVAKKRGVFIDREKIVDLIMAAGMKQWEKFETSELSQLSQAGEAYRCVMTADGQKAMLNLYFNNDGTTTITPTGTNTEISSVIKTILEEGCTYSNETQGKTYSIRKLPSEWSHKVVDYLSTLDGVTVEKHELEIVPIHISYAFTSKIGDRLTVNIYKTGTLTLQGKPAYLYGEAISFLSYCNEVSVDDIVDSVNSFHNVDVKTSDVRNEMEILMPRAYGKIDDMVLKLLSPSISLRKVKIELEDYSCYAFPALRALEGYLKYLFCLKGVTIGYNFGIAFSGDILNPSIATIINDVLYQAELEKLYVYFKRNRHVIFHTEQVLIGTTTLDDKHEADEIINSVINLIETSYTNINK